MTLVLFFLCSVAREEAVIPIALLAVVFGCVTSSFSVIFCEIRNKVNFQLMNVLISFAFFLK